jgi:hypothetical protein
LALLNVKADSLTFGEGPKTLHIDSRMVDKYILFLPIDLDEAEAFALVEPLYASFTHSRIPPFAIFHKLGYDQKIKGIDLKSFDALNCRLEHQLRPPPCPERVNDGFTE